MSTALEMVKGWSVGQLAALVYKMGDENARRMLSCRQITVTFKEEEQSACVVAEPWHIWKTIMIGTGVKDGEGFCFELEKKDYRIGDWARDMLGQKVFTVATAEEAVDLVRLSVADLGFKEGARYDAIYARAIELGLELCPAEVGPQLRVQYPDQPRGELLLIAMETIRDSHGDLRVFCLGRDANGRWLSGSCGLPAFFRRAVSLFVFRLPRKQPLAI